MFKHFKMTRHQFEEKTGELSIVLVTGFASLIILWVLKPLLVKEE